MVTGLNHELTASAGEAKRTWALIWSRLESKSCVGVGVCVWGGMYPCTFCNSTHLPLRHPYGAQSIQHWEAETGKDLGFMESLPSSVSELWMGPIKLWTGWRMTGKHEPNKQTRGGTHSCRRSYFMASFSVDQNKNSNKSTTDVELQLIAELEF